jgi:glycosyltransferase involved in cell wall biosynthesis
MDNHEDFVEKFAVLIPIHNEEKNVINLVETLDKLEISYLFIDDGSTDKTVTALWLKNVPALCYFPKRGKSFAIQLGVKYFVNEGYDWILLLDKKRNISDIVKLDEALFWKEEESKIFITEQGTRLLHKDIFSQIKSRWFDLELRWKIWKNKWKVNKVV